VTRRLPQPLVDFHVHLFPDRLFDAIRRKFVADYGWNVLHPLYWREGLAYLREWGVGTMDTAFAFLPRLGSMFDLSGDFLERNRERILYGSDFPNILFPREDEIDALLNFNLSREFYDAVFRDNGLRLIRQSGQIRP